MSKKYNMIDITDGAAEDAPEFKEKMINVMIDGDQYLDLLFHNNELSLNERSIAMYNIYLNHLLLVKKNVSAEYFYKLLKNEQQKMTTDIKSIEERDKNKGN